VKQEKIKVGVIGVGHMGEYHVQKYKALPTVDLVGIVDVNSERAKEIAHRYGTKAFNDHEELLTRVDGVSLAVPTDSHYQVAKDILTHDVHLLIEKPLTYTLEPANSLINMAREKDLILQGCLVERFNPAIVKMRSLIDQPIYIEAHRMNPFTVRGTDVDVVLDLMIHDIDIILNIVPYGIREIHAVGSCMLTGSNDVANARIIFENNTVANITASRVSDKVCRQIRVFQDSMHITVDYQKRELSLTQKDCKPDMVCSPHGMCTELFTFPDCDPLADQIASFVKSMGNGTRPAAGIPDGRKALEVSLNIIDQIEKSCQHL
jgi:predicted dehydrogenase